MLLRRMELIERRWIEELGAGVRASGDRELCIKGKRAIHQGTGSYAARVKGLYNGTHEEVPQVVHGYGCGRVGNKMRTRRE